MKEKCTRNVDGMRNVSIDGRVVAMVASTLPLASGKGLQTFPSFSLFPSFFLFPSKFSSRSRETCNAENLESRYRIEYRCRLRGVSMIVSSWMDERWESRREWDAGWISFTAIAPATVQLAKCGCSRGRHYHECFVISKIVSRKAHLSGRFRARTTALYILLFYAPCAETKIYSQPLPVSPSHAPRYPHAFG